MRSIQAKNLPKLINASLVMFIAVLGLSTGCGMVKDGKTNPVAGASSPISLTPFEQLTGEWVGIYRTLDSGKPTGEALSAKLTFNENGDFSFVLDSDLTARVEGQWTEFQGKTLILRVTGSSIPRIGSSSKVVEPKYELLGSSLLISSDAYELKLGRKAAPTTPQSPGGWHSNFVGNWTCRGTAQRNSTVLISDAAEFKLSSVRPNERAFIAVGNLSPSATAALILMPTSSSDAIPAGSSFELRQTGSSYELFFNRADLTQSNLGDCRK